MYVDRQTDGQTDGETDGQTDGQTDGETDGQTDGETDWQTDRGIDSYPENVHRMGLLNAYNTLLRVEVHVFTSISAVAELLSRFDPVTQSFF